MYLNFISCRLRPLPASESIPESPLYCPRSEFFTIVRSRRCSEQIYDILCDMRDVTALSVQLAETSFFGPREATPLPASSAASVCRRAIIRPSAALGGTAVSNDWVYESCRLAALIHCRLFLHRIPSADTRAFPPLFRLGQNLCSALARTDTGDCWGDMAGVLYWCSLVGGAAMRPAPKSPEADTWKDVRSSELAERERCRRWLTFLAVRLNVVLGLQYPEVVTITLRRFICGARPAAW